MADTVRTLDYILTNIFQEGQIQGISAQDMRDLAVTLASWTAGAPKTLVALDISTVTTGGTAVNALSATHKTAGGWIKNPESAVTSLGEIFL